MYQILKINDVEINLKNKIEILILNKFFGTKNYYLKTFKKRFEYLNFFFELDAKKEDSFIYDFFLFLNFSVPLRLNINLKYKIHILYLNIIFCYKGWRHLKGLPVRGQRTWTNAWSTFRSNIVLRDLKKKSIKKIYGKLGGPEQRISFLAEYINFLWKTQWFCEWIYSRVLLRKLIKKKKKFFNLDLYSTAKGLLGNLKKKKSVTKKKKKLLTGNIGFDQGFTKIYLKLKYNTIEFKK